MDDPSLLLDILKNFGFPVALVIALLTGFYQSILIPCRKLLGDFIESIRETNKENSDAIKQIAITFEAFKNELSHIKNKVEDIK